MTTRPASHAGSWYPSNPARLRAMLEGYLSSVPETIDGSPLPIPESRIIIAPHAGYEYSGPCAAWAYRCLDLRRAKRVFVLGPSHKYYLQGCAVSVYSEYKTPFGTLVVDTETIEKVKEEGDMDDIIKKKEVEEHSLEMHMPYLYLMCERALKSEENFPKIVPLLIGTNNLEEEQEIGHVLAPYMKDPENAFIISSDFCHWGDSSFSYTPYSPDCNINKLRSLSRFDPVPNGEPIHETIRTIDEAAMDAVKSGSHAAFVRNLRLTKNTVCGRHPIGVAMAAMEIYANELTRNPSGRVNDDEETSDDSVEIKNPRFSIIQYDRSNLVEDPSDFSVSYVSAYAVL